jgi:hypothetical protein
MNHIAPSPIDRLARLERSHRRLQRITLVLCLLLVSGTIIAATTPPGETLEAKSLKIVDHEGKPRVLLTASTGVTVLDSAGKPRAVLGVDAEGPGLVLFGGKAIGRAILNINKDGPALTFTGAGNVLRAVFALIPRGPGLVLFDEQQNERAMLTVSSGAGVLELEDIDGKPVGK